jgi:hypothetical protein
MSIEPVLPLKEAGGYQKTLFGWRKSQPIRWRGQTTRRKWRRGREENAFFDFEPLSHWPLLLSFLRFYPRSGRLRVDSLDMISLSLFSLHNMEKQLVTWMTKCVEPRNVLKVWGGEGGVWGQRLSLSLRLTHSLVHSYYRRNLMPFFSISTLRNDVIE